MTDQRATWDGRCRDGYYRGCDFMGCDDWIAQRGENGRVVAPCRIYGPPVPPEVFDDRRVTS